MTPEELQQFLSKSNNAIVGVNRANGAPQLTVVWFAYDGTNFYFSTTRDRAKYPNIKRDPRIALIVDDFDSHTYVAAYGTAEILEHDYAEPLRLVLQKYMPAERIEQAVQGTLNDPSRVLVVLHPEKIVTR